LERPGRLDYAPHEDPVPAWMPGWSGREAKAQPLGHGAALLRGYAATDIRSLLDMLGEIAGAAALRRMVVPGGRSMSVAMTNCGFVGWVTDRSGYRYERLDPTTGRPWPPIPAAYLALARAAAAEAGFLDFEPDACLVNEYLPGSKLSLHRDSDERDLSQPIVSVSLGLPATFLFGGLERVEKPRRIRLQSGDVVVWGGPSRLVFHGVARLADGFDPMAGARRVNLTFRRAL